jgi:hypothetical protein
MSGSARLTMVPSSTAMTMPRMMTSSARSALARGQTILNKHAQTFVIERAVSTAAA